MFKSVIYTLYQRPIESRCDFRSCVEAYKWAKSNTKYGDDILIILNEFGKSVMYGQIDEFAERWFYEEEVD